jgi:hypothetical protein
MAMTITESDFDAPTRKCTRCGERFALKRRRGRNLSGRKRLRPTRYHEGARYCSDTCRKLASKARRPTPQQPSPGEAGNRSKTHPGPQVLSTVTNITVSSDISKAYKGEKSGRASPKKPALDQRIVPDGKWSGMYRIRRPDGSLSDMVNLTWAKDALRSLDERRQSWVSPAEGRPVFTIRIRAEPGVDPIRALRALLKVMLRRLALRAVDAHEDDAS